MKNKIRVAVIFGGRSAEHEVSLQSAKNVIEGLDKNKYEVIPIGINKNGEWFLGDKSISLAQNGQSVALLKGKNSSQLVNLSNSHSLGQIDVVFPVLHGPYGEDGSVQGLIKLADIAHVGPGILGSAVCMDKDVTKRLLKEADVAVAEFLVYLRQEKDKINFDKVSKQLGLPMFVKPANLGSSVGVSKVNNEKEFKEAVDLAFSFDNKILIEESIKGREIECAVLGNENPQASIPGEIIPSHDFYSYDAKYIDENGAKLKAPADLPPAIISKIQKLAMQVFKILCVEGMARVDFFLADTGKIYVNEINTIPGFTKISMYPKLWELSGISNSELLDRLIMLARKRHNRDQKLKTSY